MNILHVISSPAAGGAEVYVKDLATDLAKNGHRVFVGFLERASDTGRSLVFEENFLQELDRCGISYFFIGHECRQKPWLGMARVSRFVAVHDIDLYHAHLPYGVVFGARLRVPRVYTHHQSEPRFRRFIFRLFNQVIDRYIGISRRCADTLTRHTGREVTEIANGIDIARFPARARQLSASGTVHALAVGRIHPDKDYRFLVDALRALPDAYRSRLQVTIVGEGDAVYESTLKQYAAEGSALPRFTFLGNRNDIPALLNDADLFLMSSAQEGLPISLIEAAVSGLPCIVTDVGGCREIIDLCDNGYAVTHGDVQGYVTAVCHMLSDTTRFARLSLNAAAKRQLLDIDRVTQRHLDVYESLVNKSC